MSISILGIGTVSTSGSGIASLREGLSGTRAPLLERHPIETSRGEISLPVMRARVENLDRFIPSRASRRMDNFTKMALLSSCLALEDAGLVLEDKTRVGIVFGTGYGPLQTTFGFLDSILDSGDKCASPTLFATSVHNSPASQISIHLKIQGPCQTISCFHRTTANVFLTAQGWLEQEAADFVLVGVGDEYCAVRGYAVAGLGGAGTEGIRPFSFEECSYVPGEGCVCMLLGRDSSQETKYCRLDKIIVRSDMGKEDHLLFDSLDALFIGANGDRDMGLHYQALLPPGKKIAAYSPLYGGMPVGAGFDLAVACLSLHDKKLYPTPVSDEVWNRDLIAVEEPIPDADFHIGCLECGPEGIFDLFVLSR